MKGSTTSPDIERKRHFLTLMRRWQAIFKRTDSGSIDQDRWLIAEYYKSIGHLSEAGLEALTDQLKRRCVFFPSIKECLDIINVPRLSGEWGNPFINRSPALYHDTKVLAAPARPVGAIGRYRGTIEDEVEDSAA